jgi:hypothetical protein
MNAFLYAQKINEIARMASKNLQIISNILKDNSEVPWNESAKIKVFQDMTPHFPDDAASKLLRKDANHI